MVPTGTVSTTTSVFSDDKARWACRVHTATPEPPGAAAARPGRARGPRAWNSARTCPPQGLRQVSGGPRGSFSEKLSENQKTKAQTNVPGAQEIGALAFCGVNISPDHWLLWLRLISGPIYCYGKALSVSRLYYDYFQK